MENQNERPSFDGSFIVLDDTKEIGAVSAPTPSAGVEFDPRRRLFSPMDSSTPNSLTLSASYVEMSTIEWHGDALKKVVSDLEATIKHLEEVVEKLKAQKAELLKLL